MGLFADSKSTFSSSWSPVFQRSASHSVSTDEGSSSDPAAAEGPAESTSLKPLTRFRSLLAGSMYSFSFASVFLPASCGGAGISDTLFLLAPFSYSGGPGPFDCPHEYIWSALRQSGPRLRRTGPRLRQLACDCGSLVRNWAIQKDVALRAS